jgi:MobA/MobL family
MLNVVHDARTRALYALAAPSHAPFRCAQVKHPDPSDLGREEARKTHHTALASYLYIHRIPGRDHLGQLPPDYLSKSDDLVCTGRRHPLKGVPVVMRSGPQIWAEADAATRDDLAQAAAVHVILTLPNIPQKGWQPLVERFVDDHLVSLGHVVDFAIHAKPDDSGSGWGTHPHVHLLCSARRFKSDQRKGQRMRVWLHSKVQVEALETAWLAVSGLPPRIIA